MPFANEQHIRAKDPLLAQALDSIVRQIQNVATATASSVSGFSAAPSPISSLSVTAANGIFDVQIQDNSPVNRGVQYFLEYSTTPGFQQPILVSLGPARNFRSTWGSVTLYFRAYSQYPTSAPSAPVYFGPPNNPTAVVGGGAAGPTIQASTGSGTAPNNGQSGGAGFGYTGSRGKPSTL